MSNKMLIDATHPEETRVVVLRGNRVEEFDFEAADRQQLRGNIYLAKVTRVEPSLQAAFVDYGGNRHGFLAFSEIHPDYYQIPYADRQALLQEQAREDEEQAAEEAGEASAEEAAALKRRAAETAADEAAPSQEAARSRRRRIETEPASPSAVAADAGSADEPAPYRDDRRRGSPLRRERGRGRRSGRSSSRRRRQPMLPRVRKSANRSTRRPPATPMRTSRQTPTPT